jgi:hypothetical protein
MAVKRAPKQGAYYVIRGAEYDIWWACQYDDVWMLRRVNAQGYIFLTDEELIEVDRWGNRIESSEREDERALEIAAAARVEEWRINAVASALLKEVDLRFA